MALIEQGTTGAGTLPIQLPPDTIVALKAAVAAEKADYDSDPATYAGLGETMDKFVNNAIKAYIP